MEHQPQIRVRKLTALAGVITNADQPGDTAICGDSPAVPVGQAVPAVDNGKEKGPEMPMFTSLSREASWLSAGLQGEVVLPGQPGFDEARRAFNLAADQEPAAVVFAAMPLGPLTDTVLRNYGPDLAQAGDEQWGTCGDEGRL